jgi:hypothetical protein
MWWAERTAREAHSAEMQVVRSPSPKLTENELRRKAKRPTGTVMMSRMKG